MIRNVVIALTFLVWVIGTHAVTIRLKKTTDLQDIVVMWTQQRAENTNSNVTKTALYETAQQH